MAPIRRPLAATLSLLAVLAASSGCGGASDNARGAEATGARFPAQAQIAKVIGEGGTPLIRTDYSDNKAWKFIAKTTKAPDATDTGDSEYGPYEPYIETVEDKELDGWTSDSFALVWDAKRSPGYILVADAQSVREAAAGGIVTVDYVDLSMTPEEARKNNEELGESDYYVYGRSFRCQLEQVASIEANLSISNMDFFEFADDADKHAGVFTGFPSADG